jgi:hypothetical protein
MRLSLKQLFFIFYNYLFDIYYRLFFSSAIVNEKENHLSITYYHQGRLWTCYIPYSRNIKYLNMGCDIFIENKDGSELDITQPLGCMYHDWKSVSTVSKFIKIDENGNEESM